MNEMDDKLERILGSWPLAGIAQWFPSAPEAHGRPLLVAQWPAEPQARLAINHLFTLAFRIGVYNQFAPDGSARLFFRDAGQVERWCDLAEIYLQELIETDIEQAWELACKGLT